MFASRSSHGGVSCFVIEDYGELGQRLGERLATDVSARALSRCKYRTLPSGYLIPGVHAS